MKILQICHKPLFGKPDGGKIAMQAMAEGLKEAGAEVAQLMIETPQHRIPKDAKSKFDWNSVFINTRLNYFSALKNLILSRSYNLSRFDNKKYHQQLKNSFKSEYDVILAEGIYTLANCISWRAHTKAKLVLRTHNIEFLIWERMIDQESNFLRKAYLKILAKQLKKEETEIFKAVDAIIAISDYDRDIIKKLHPEAKIEVVPIATKLEKLDKQAHIDDLFHLGAMDWRPNREGVDWFLNAVWKNLRNEFPELSLFLAGKAMPDNYYNLKDLGVEVEDVDNASDFYAKHGVMVVPLLSGSGIRVKIIEGLALGKVIITTPQGVEGIPARHGKELFIASSYKEFSLIIRQLRESPTMLKEISENACTFARENYRTEVLGKKTLDFLLKVI